MPYRLVNSGDIGPRPRRTGRPMTPVRAFTRVTYTAPVTDPGGRSRPEVWSARSRDGLWHYERLDDHELDTPWTVTYLPTGQRRDGYQRLTDARAATAAALPHELRIEAANAAYREPAAEDRAAAQRWLAIHMRLAGADESDTACRCGGLLVAVDDAGRLAHVDACRMCHVPGTPGIAAHCDQAAYHLFCPDPAPTKKDKC